MLHSVRALQRLWRSYVFGSLIGANQRGMSSTRMSPTSGALSTPLVLHTLGRCDGSRIPFRRASYSAIGRNFLQDLKALELGVSQGGRLLITRPRVRFTKCLRLGPSLKVGVAAPHRVRGIEHVVLAFWSAQQMEGDETWEFVQIGIPTEPNVFEILGALF